MQFDWLVARQSKSDIKNLTFMHNRHPEYHTTNKIKNMAESVEAFEFSLQETLKDLSKNGKQIDLKPEQGAAIKSLVYGQDVLAILSTGFGKSAIYQILVRVSETMVLPELSRTMAYTTRNTVNRLARKELYLNPVVPTIKGAINLYIELQRHKLDQIVARNIRISLDKRIAFSKYSYGVSEEKRTKGKYDTRDKNLSTCTVLANSSNHSRARRHNLECKLVTRSQ